MCFDGHCFYNLYSWCSFLTSPDFFGYPYPKAPFHAYKMVSELAGKRVEAIASGGNTQVFAAVDPATRTLRVILWNFATYVPEFEPMVEEGKTETIKLKIAYASLPSDARAVLRMVDKEHGDVLSADRAKRPVDLAAATPKTATLPIRPHGKNLEFDLVMKPGSIAMIEIGPDPVVPSLQTSYSVKAEILLKVMRDHWHKQPEETLGTGEQLLKLADVHSEQKLDALVLMTTAAARARKPDAATRFAHNAETLCNALDKPLPHAVAHQLGDSEWSKKQFAGAVVRYGQALDAPDCDWRARFGTELRLIECLNLERKFADVIRFCDSVIARKDDDSPSELKGDFLLRKLEALRNLGKTEQMFAAYKELLNSNAHPNAKLGGVIAVVVFHRSQKQLEKASAEGQVGLALKETHPGLLSKLKAILKQIVEENMIEIGPDPVVPSLQTSYSVKAEILLKVMRDHWHKQPEETLGTGEQLLKLADVHSEQKLDALVLMTTAAARARKPDAATRFAHNAETLCNALDKPLPHAVAHQLGDSEWSKKQFAGAVVRYGQALDAPDCDWRARFGTELRLIECLNLERKFADVIRFCDSVIARKDDDSPSELKGDFLLRKLEALRNLGKTEQMFAAYKELLNSNAHPNAKLGGVIAVVVFHRSQKQLDKASAEGQVGLALKKTHPGLLSKLTAILEQIVEEKTKQK